jgi:hypothetical protein
MVKKADALVRTYSNRMHTIDSALQTFTTMTQPQDIAAALERTGTAKFFAGTNPAKPRNSLSTPRKTALRSARTTPRVSFMRNERPVIHVAKEVKVSPKAPNPVSNVASALPSSKARYPPKTGMDTIECFQCKKMGHFARDCPNPGPKQPYVLRNKSPGPTRKPAMPNAHIAVESNQDAPSFEWDHEAPGI